MPQPHVLQPLVLQPHLTALNRDLPSIAAAPLQTFIRLPKAAADVGVRNRTTTGLNSEYAHAAPLPPAQNVRMAATVTRGFLQRIATEAHHSIHQNIDAAKAVYAQSRNVIENFSLPTSFSLNLPAWNSETAFHAIKSAGLSLAGIGMAPTVDHLIKNFQSSLQQTRQAWDQVRLDPNESNLLQLGSGAGALAWAVGSTYLEKGKLPSSYKIDGELWPRVGHQMIVTRESNVVHKTLHGEIHDIDAAGRLQRKILLSDAEARHTAAHYFYFQNEIGKNTAPGVFLPLRNLNGLRMEQDYAVGKHHSVLTRKEKEIFDRDRVQLLESTQRHLSSWPGARRFPADASAYDPQQVFVIKDFLLKPDLNPDNFRFQNNRLIGFDNSLVLFSPAASRLYSAPFF